MSWKIQLVMRYFQVITNALGLDGRRHTLIFSHNIQISVAYFLELCRPIKVFALCHLRCMPSTAMAVHSISPQPHVMSCVWFLPCDYVIATYGIALLSVCMSVCLSLCQTHRLWQNERNLCPHSYTTSKIIHTSFWREWLVGWPRLPKILSQTDTDGAKTPICNRHLVVAPLP